MSRVAYTRPFSDLGWRPQVTKPFAAAHGLGALGNGDSSADISQFFQLGFSGVQIKQILAAHDSGALSDEGYQSLLQGGVPPSGLASFLEEDCGAGGCPQNASSSPSQQTVPTMPSAPTSGVPAGSMITYQGTWVTTNTRTANDILNQVLAALPKDGINVLQSQSNAGLLANTSLFGLAEPGQSFNVTLQLQPSSAYSQPRDVASIVDHEVYVASGVMPRGSGAALVGTSGSGLPGSGDLVQWLENNLTWIALAAGAIFILPPLIKKL